MQRCAALSDRRLPTLQMCLGPQSSGSFPLKTATSLPRKVNFHNPRMPRVNNEFQTWKRKGNKKFFLLPTRLRTLSDFTGYSPILSNHMTVVSCEPRINSAGEPRHTRKTDTQDCLIMKETQRTSQLLVYSNHRKVMFCFRAKNMFLLSGRRPFHAKQTMTLIQLKKVKWSRYAP
jgi:hypothetical protein